MLLADIYLLCKANFFDTTPPGYNGISNSIKIAVDNQNRQKVERIGDQGLVPGRVDVRICIPVVRVKAFNAI